MFAMPQNTKLAGAPIKPFAEYHMPTRAVCSSRFHHENLIRINPWLRHDSKTPRKKRAVTSVAKFLALAVAASVAPV